MQAKKMNNAIFSMDSFIQRIRILMERENLKKWNQFEGEIGMRGATNRWKSGKDKPTADSLLKISKRFKVSVDWLLTGQEPENHLAEPREEYDLHPQPAVDTELIAEIVRSVEEYLNQVRLKISPLRKGKLVARLYEYCVMEKTKPDSIAIKSYLRLIS
jgi:transcriptional regulator with XRE-family HTH domain